MTAHPTRTIASLPNGNVAVYTHIAGTPSIEMREYKRRGRIIYMLRDVGPPQPVCRELRLTGEPLYIPPGATLAETIKRALDERDGVIGPAWADKVGKWLERLFWGALAAAVVAAWVSGAVDLVTSSVIK